MSLNKSLRKIKCLYEILNISKTVGNYEKIYFLRETFQIFGSILYKFCHKSGRRFKSLNIEIDFSI